MSTSSRHRARRCGAGEAAFEVAGLEVGDLRDPQQSVSHAGGSPQAFSVPKTASAADATPS